jgi:vacuolar-type H+-ATPase subunit E/Vma4
MDKKQAEQYYPLYDECSKVAHTAIIEFSNIHSDISKEIEKLDKQIKENKEPLKSKYIGEKKSAIFMHQTMIKNVASAKKLRDNLNKEKQRLTQILRSK